MNQLDLLPEKEKPQGQLPLWVHSKLDDAGLTKSERSVIMHIARRGKCYSSLQTMSRLCDVDSRYVRAALKTLADRGMIGKKDRPGMTPIFELNPMRKWVVGHGMSRTPLQKRHPTPLQKRHPTPLQKRHPTPLQKRHPTPLQKGPTKDIPLRTLHFPLKASPLKESENVSTSVNNSPVVNPTLDKKRCITGDAFKAADYEKKPSPGGEGRVRASQTNISESKQLELWSRARQLIPDCAKHNTGYLLRLNPLKFERVLDELEHRVKRGRSVNADKLPAIRNPGAMLTTLWKTFTD